jgi:CDGSH-type Zn-finger protein/uncharacterized Fe-S cluster protein YjdI
MSFTALRDAAPVLPGASANHFFTERLAELAAGANRLAASGDARTLTAARMIGDLARRGARGFGSARVAAAPANSAQSTVAAPSIAAAGGQSMSTTAKDASAPSAPAGSPPAPTVIDGVDHIEGKDLTLLYEGKKCIHARFCVTGAPEVFLANVKGPWINPDAIGVDRLVEISHACPSGAIRYARKDGKPDETPPPVNLIAVREAGPYAVRGQLVLDGEPISFRATLCRCGASKNKPFCDGSHHEANFSATGEPPTTKKTDMLPTRDGPLAIDPQPDGPLQVTGNLEITSGTGRVVTRVVKTWLCRCGGSSNKPFCDGTHSKIGFRST